MFDFSYKDEKDAESEKYWQVKKNNNYIEEIDMALMVRLISGCNDKGFEINTIVLEKLLYKKYKKEHLKNLVDIAYTLYQKKQQD